MGLNTKRWVSICWFFNNFILWIYPPKHEFHTKKRKFPRSRTGEVEWSGKGGTIVTLTTLKKLINPNVSVQTVWVCYSENCCMTRVCILELIEDMTLHRLLTEMNSCNHIDLKTKHVHDLRPQSPPDTHPTPNTPSPVQPRIQKVRGGVIM